LNGFGVNLESLLEFQESPTSAQIEGNAELFESRSRSFVDDAMNMLFCVDFFGRGSWETRDRRRRRRTREKCIGEEVIGNYSRSPMLRGVFSQSNSV